jgi:hypothetical protein
VSRLMARPKIFKTAGPAVVFKLLKVGTPMKGR